MPERAAEIGKYVIERLNDLAKKYKTIGDVRGRGLMIGVELVKDKEKKTPAVEEAEKIKVRMLEKGVIIGVGGVKKCTLRIQPCLTITKEQIDSILTTLEEAIQTVSR